MNKKTWILTLSLLITSIYFVNIVSASDISAYRECPEYAKVGSIVQINITVENNGALEKDITIDENLGEFEPIEPKPIVPTGEPGMIGIRLPYYEWNFTLQPNSKKTVHYTVKLLNPGDIAISPTTVYADGEVFYTEDICMIKVVCNENRKCEPDLGENYFTCSEDCPSGSADGVCDLIKDGTCDPDCTKEADEDCMKPPMQIPWTYVILSVVSIAGLAFILYYKKSQSKSKPNWQDLKEKWK